MCSPTMVYMLKKAKCRHRNVERRTTGWKMEDEWSVNDRRRSRRSLWRWRRWRERNSGLPACLPACLPPLVVSSFSCLVYLVHLSLSLSLPFLQVMQHRGTDGARRMRDGALPVLDICLYRYRRAGRHAGWGACGVIQRHRHRRPVTTGIAYPSVPTYPSVIPAPVPRETWRKRRDGGLSCYYYQHVQYVPYRVSSPLSLYLSALLTSLCTRTYLTNGRCGAVPDDLTSSLRARPPNLPDAKRRRDGRRGCAEKGQAGCLTGTRQAANATQRNARKEEIRHAGGRAGRRWVREGGREKKGRSE
ncbi:hypothetical protein IWX90DRAFT_294789 [Phyllosticta citrichinensis]|uniref:Uncharacterized protein n=1 Tax=Phyllosticta citrichinensis TaxID=1130410 RepID=A0ABR1XKA1_9PEZI